MSDYHGIEPLHGTLDYGDYDVPADSSVCRACGEPLSKPGSQVCHKHAVALYKARQQARRLCELARQRRVEARLARGRAMIHKWWMATEGR